MTARRKFRLGWLILGSVLTVIPLLFAGCQDGHDGGSVNDGHMGHSH